MFTKSKTNHQSPMPISIKRNLKFLKRETKLVSNLIQDRRKVVMKMRLLKSKRWQKNQFREPRKSRRA